MIQGVHDPELVRAELERVLARAEFRQEKSLLQEFLEWLAQRLGAPQLDFLGALVPWLFSIALAGGVLFLLTQVWKARRLLSADGSGVAEHAGPTVRERIEVLLERARAALAANDLRLALRLYFLALLLILGGRGDLVFRDSWTNREHLRRGKPSRRARSVLEPLVRELEAKDFGDRPIVEADLERLEALVARHQGGAA